MVARTATGLPQAIVSIDGQIVRPEAATVPVWDRGFLFGDSVFEVLRTYRGAPFAEHAHLNRLGSSAARIGIALPWSGSELASELAAVVAAFMGRDSATSGGVFSEAYLRAIVTRGSGPLAVDPTTALSPRRVIIAAALPAQPAGLYRDGVILRSVGAPSQAGQAAAGAKASNYLNNLLALQRARGEGAHEALLVSPSGQVLEGATSNVFLVAGDRLRSPGLGAGILPGITRGLVIELARGLGLATTEDVVVPADLYRADEIFITSSLRELVPVVEIDGVTIGGGSPGPWWARLRAAYSALTLQAGAADRLLGQVMAAGVPASND